VNRSFLQLLPNILTLSRLLFTVLFVLAMLWKGDTVSNVPVIIFSIAALTDLFDGILARHFKAISNFGKLVDPLADKILVMAALVMLVGERHSLTCLTAVPAWMVVLVLGREIWVTGLRGVAASNGTIIAAGQSGKIKSVLQMVAIFLLLLHEVEIEIGVLIFPLRFFGLNILFVSILFSYWGAIDYTYRVMLGDKGLRE
jgi:CDP-diacylglycerol--glycerol-3-phosphate 3-phosphatidyltransferase